MKKWSEFLEGRCWPGYKPKPGKKAFSPGSCMKESAAAAVAAAIAISKKKSGNYDKEGFRKTTYKNPDHPNRKSNTERESELKEDLRNWFSKTNPKGDWKRINSKGEAIGPCAREPGEPKPKCMSQAQRASLSKKERASAVRRKRQQDPNAERQGAPINVKSKVNENMKQLDEKNKPTNPELWSRAIAQAKSKFDVYPSAYANGWASKWYKSKGGGWKSVNEAKDEQEYGYEGDMALNQLATLTRCADMIKDLLKPDTDMPEWVQSKITLATDYIQTAADYMYSEMKEEVEPIEELSKDTLKSYIPAAARDLSKKGVNAGIEARSGKPGVTKEYGDHFEKRYKGIIKATRKLAKESVVNEVMDEPNYSLSIQARQKKADVSKKNDANMPADIGTPAQLSLRVKSKKLETPVYESRQLEIVREAMADAKKKDAIKKKEQKVTPGGDDKFQSEPELTSSITKNT